MFVRRNSLANVTRLHDPRVFEKLPKHNVAREVWEMERIHDEYGVSFNCSVRNRVRLFRSSRHAWSVAGVGANERIRNRVGMLC